MNRKKITALALTFTLLTTNAVSVFATSSLESQLRTQQQELEATQSELDEEKTQQEEILAEIRAVEAELEAKGAELVNLMIEMDEVQGEISDKLEEIEELEEEIERLLEEIADEEEKYAARLRGMYISGQTNYLEIALGGGTLAEANNRINAVQAIMEYDTELLEHMASNKLALEKNMAKVEEDKEELAKLEESLEGQLKVAEAVQAEQEELLAEFNAMNEEHASVIIALESQVVSQEVAIAQLMSDIEESNNNNNNDNSGSNGGNSGSGNNGGGNSGGGNDNGGNDNGSATGNAAVASARKYLGVRYQYGGTNPSTGLDCSGLTQLAYKDIGVTIGRSTYDQINNGRSVSRSELVAGDLVFFSQSGYLSHVGMYSGGGNMVHASASRGVVEQNINTYWGPYYEAARRIVN